MRIEGPAEQPIAWVRADTGWVLLHSRRDPVRDADALLKELADPLPHGLVIVGLGLGYLIDALAARGWTGRVLALEPEPGLVPALLARPICADWLAAGRLRVVTAPDYPQTTEALMAFGLHEPQPMLHPVLSRTHVEGTRRALSILARAADGARANAEAKGRLASLVLRNTLSNLKQLAQESDVTALEGALAGQPAIVVAAGPSLDGQLDHLRDAQSKATVIAVDTAARPLLMAGIRPHLIVAVDPTTINASHLLELSGAECTWLVAEGSVDPHAMAAFRGRVFGFRVGWRHPWPWLNAEGCDSGTLRAWGSVLTTAVDLAVRMGATTIAFAGADLAFTGNRPYCRGTTFEETWRRSQDCGTPLESFWAASVSSWPRLDEPGIAGQVCHTAPHLVAFRDWIVEQTAARDQLRIVNTTGAGILVASHVEQLSLAELAAGWPQVDARARLASAWTPAARAWRSLPAVLKTLETGEARAAEALAAWEQATGERLDLRTAAALIAGVPSAEAAGVGEQTATVYPADTFRPSPDLSVSDEARLREIRETLPSHAALVTVALTGTEADPQSLARDALARAGQDGVVALIDQSSLPLGEWGRQVALDLVRAEPALWTEFSWYLDWQRRVTLVRRAPPPQPDFLHADAFKCGPANLDAAHGIVEILVHRFLPASVADIGPGDGAWLDAFRARGVRDTIAVPVAHACAAASDTARPRVDLCLCLGVVDRLDEEGAGRVIARCTAMSDLIVFAAMDPGRGASDVPLARTLGWWAERFLREGFLLSDELRPAIEARWPVVRDVYDYLVCFRRVMSPAEADAVIQLPSLRRGLVALADRIDVLRARVTAEQLAHLRVRSRRHSPPMSTVRMTLPRARLHRAAPGVLLFRFRTRAARRWLAQREAGDLRVFEGTVPMAQDARKGASGEIAPGRFVMTGDDLHIRPLSEDDARIVGPSLFVDLPQDIAAAESVPLDVIVQYGL